MSSANPHNGTQKARYQRRMALWWLNGWLKAGMMGVFWQAVTVCLAEREGFGNKVSIMM